MADLAALEAAGVPIRDTTVEERAVLYDGRFISARTPRGFVIDNATPRLTILGGLIEAMRTYLPQEVELGPNYIRITAINMRVVYRFDAYDPRRDLYLASAPD